MRRKDCAGEVQIVERTLSMKEATRDFPKNQSFVVCTRREEGEGSRGMEGPGRQPWEEWGMTVDCGKSGGVVE